MNPKICKRPTWFIVLNKTKIGLPMYKSANYYWCQNEIIRFKKGNPELHVKNRLPIISWCILQYLYNFVFLSTTTNRYS